jgi:hypothetical protein
MAELIEAANLETAEHILSATYGSMRISARGQRRGLQPARPGSWSPPPWSPSRTTP